jgi:hypothetical protein
MTILNGTNYYALSLNNAFAPEVALGFDFILNPFLTPHD